ncbi:MAG TPA: hypothetical protein VEF03_06325 [Candidatus Binataceae bacterium]|nr:hypothetical protein [Candidatus Binataceae bacterium]
MKSREKPCSIARSIRATAACIVLGAVLIAIAPPNVSAQDRRSSTMTEFDILNPSSGALIGHARYVFEYEGANLTITGENRYQSGEYDLEQDSLGKNPDGDMPVLLRFRHMFFRADKSTEYDASLDTTTGEAACVNFLSSPAGERKAATLDVPPDTYAGASLLIPIQAAMRHGGSAATELHAFNCAGAPRLLKVEIKPAGERRWNRYPATVMRADLKADFGFWDFMIQPFLPKLVAFFDPADDLAFVGGQLERYYRGPKIELVRSQTSPEQSKNQDSASLSH